MTYARVALQPPHRAMQISVKPQIAISRARSASGLGRNATTPAGGRWAFNSFNTFFCLQATDRTPHHASNSFCVSPYGQACNLTYSIGGVISHFFAGLETLARLLSVSIRSVPVGAGRLDQVPYSILQPVRAASQQGSL